MRDYQTVADANYYLGRHFEFYNNRRLHQELKKKFLAAKICPVNTIQIGSSRESDVELMTDFTKMTKGEYKLIEWGQ